MKNWQRVIGAAISGALAYLGMIFMFPGLFLDILLSFEYPLNYIVGIPMLFLAIIMIYKLVNYR